jgi:hypothetical protein
MRSLLTPTIVVTEPVFHVLISSLNEAAFLKASAMSVTVSVSQLAISPYVEVSPPTQAVHAPLKLALVIAVAASAIVSAKRMTQMDKVRLLHVLSRNFMIVDRDDDDDER